MLNNTMKNTIKTFSRLELEKLAVGRSESALFARDLLAEQDAEILEAKEARRKHAAWRAEVLGNAGLTGNEATRSEHCARLDQYFSSKVTHVRDGEYWLRLGPTRTLGYGVEDRPAVLRVLVQIPEGEKGAAVWEQGDGARPAYLRASKVRSLETA